MSASVTDSSSQPSSQTEKATFAGGCFWCTEAVFQRVPGVVSVISGYTGGHTKNPTYHDISSGRTGHAEAVQIEYRPGEVSYNELLELFWRAHDPTQLNRQGPDVGSQYRSAVFYHNEEQQQAAEASKQALERSGVFKNLIVTEIAEAGTFYPAEKYHQDYYRNNPNALYCVFNITPKLKKLGLE